MSSHVRLELRLIIEPLVASSAYEFSLAMVELKSGFGRVGSIARFTDERFRFNLVLVEMDRSHMINQLRLA